MALDVYTAFSKNGYRGYLLGVKAAAAQSW